jgi:hypothetical protein
MPDLDRCDDRFARAWCHRFFFAVGDNPNVPSTSAR